MAEYTTERPPNDAEQHLTRELGLLQGGDPLNSENTALTGTGASMRELVDAADTLARVKLYGGNDHELSLDEDGSGFTIKPVIEPNKPKNPEARRHRRKVGIASVAALALASAIAAVAGSNAIKQDPAAHRINRTTNSTPYSPATRQYVKEHGIVTLANGVGRYVKVACTATGAQVEIGIDPYMSGGALDEFEVRGEPVTEACSDLSMLGPKMAIALTELPEFNVGYALSIVSSGTDPKRVTGPRSDGPMASLTEDQIYEQLGPIENLTGNRQAS